MSFPGTQFWNATVRFWKLANARTKLLLTVLALGVVVSVAFVAISATSSSLPQGSKDALLWRGDASGSALKAHANLPACRVDPPAVRLTFQQTVEAVGNAKKLWSDKAPTSGFSKWNSHIYHTAYDLFLWPLRGSKVRILEIGLGCDMPHGVGASTNIWRSYFDCPYLVEFEYDGKCLEGFRSELDGAVQGDQGNVEDLQRAIALGPYHIIVEDGSHKSSHQIISLMTLFPTLPPGGLYFCEDLVSAFIPAEGGKPGYLQPAATLIGDLVKLILVREFAGQPGMPPGYELPDSLMPEAVTLSPFVESVHCVSGLCVFVRK